jgi:cytochrome c
MIAMRLSLAATVIALGVLGLNDSASGQDAEKGESVFRRCMACHRIGEGAKNLVGPQLNGVVGRHAGTAEGYAYSPLNKSAGEAGLVWTEENLVSYLEDPNAFLKKFLTEKGKSDQATGSTKMIFKVPSEEDRKDVVAYLKKFSPEAK